MSSFALVVIFWPLVVHEIALVIVIPSVLLTLPSLEGFAAFGQLDFNLPIIKRCFSVHVFYSLTSIFFPNKVNVCKSTRVPSLVVFNHIHCLDRPISRKYFANCVFVGTSWNTSNVNDWTVLFNSSTTFLILLNILAFRNRPLLMLIVISFAGRCWRSQNNF